MADKKMLKVKLVKSMFGRGKKHMACVRSIHSGKKSQIGLPGLRMQLLELGLRPGVNCGRDRDQQYHRCDFESPQCDLANHRREPENLK